MTSLLTLAHRRLSTLAGLLEGGPEISDARGVLDGFMQGWGERDVSLPPFPSHIGDDHSPFEFSVAFAANGAPELRLLVEAQSTKDAATLADTRDASLLLNERLCERYNLPLERFEAVRDLFLPTNPEGAFSLWHAACMWKGRAPEFKLYLNPQCQGAGEARRIVREALDRLGLRDSAQGLFERGGQRGEELDEIRYFSLDLSRSERARVKVYYRHHRATPSDLERAFSYAPGHRSGDASAFLARMAPGVRVFGQKPVGSCFSYVQGQAEPLAVTMHLPIAHYADSDLVAAQRIADELPAGRARDGYVRMITAFATRSLAEGAGIQSYASYRREPAGLRTTVYLSPEVYQPGMCGLLRANSGLAGEPSANDNGVSPERRSA